MYRLFVIWEDDAGEHEEEVGFPIEERSKANHFAREVLTAKLRELGDDVDVRVRIEEEGEVPTTYRLISGR